MIDNFEIMGLWWLPEKDNKKIPGTLKFVADKEIKLELMGSFHESINQALKSKQPLNFEIILGVSKGISFTLFKSEELNTSFGAANSEFILSTFQCKYIFKGVHFFSVNDVNFAQMVVGFTHLEDWISPNLFKFEDVNAISYNNPPKQIVKINKINSLISIVSGVTRSTDSKRVSMEINSFFVIKPLSESKDLEWYEDVIRCLGNFLTLAVGRAIYSKNLTAYLSENYKFKIYFVLNMQKEENIHSSMMMLPYRSLTSYLDKFLNNWFDYSDLLKPVYELFFGTYYAQLYEEFNFLSLIQAIEAYHRRIYVDKGKYLSDNDYEPLERSLINSIPTALPDGRDYPIGFTDALKAKIKYGNEYSLRTRLKQLSNVWGSLDPLLYENRDSFNHDIVCTRNYLTHYEKSPDCRVFEGDDLAYANIIIHSLFLIVLITHMGIPKLDAFRIVWEHNSTALTNAMTRVFQD